MKKGFKKTAVFALAVFCLVAGARSQARRGSVQISGDQKVATLLRTHVEFNEKVKTVAGYRIQIASFSGNNSKSSAFAMKQRFMGDFSGMTAYVIFNEPNFQVKIGDFISRLDAYVFLQQIKNTYPGALIIRDNVYPIRWDNEDFVPENENELQ